MKQTRVNLDIFFEGEHEPDIVHDMIINMLSDYEEIFGIHAEYILHEIEVEE